MSIENCVSFYTIQCIGGLDFVVKEKEVTVELSEGLLLD